MFFNIQIFLRFHTKPSIAQEIVSDKSNSHKKSGLQTCPSLRDFGSNAQLPTDAQSDGKSTIRYYYSNILSYTL